MQMRPERPPPSDDSEKVGMERFARRLKTAEQVSIGFGGHHIAKDIKGMRKL